MTSHAITVRNQRFLTVISIKQLQLFLVPFFPEKLHFSSRDFVGAFRLPDQERRVFVVLAEEGFHTFGIEVRVTVSASVAAGIVLADVDAFRAAAFRTLIRVFFCADGATRDFFDQ